MNVHSPYALPAGAACHDCGAGTGATCSPECPSLERPDCPTCEDRTELWIGTERDTGQPITTDCPDCPVRTSA